MAYTINKTLLDVSASTVTGGPVLIQEATQLVLSIVTQVGTASSYTVQMSNDDGLTSALGNFAFSNATVITAQGVYGVETGARWIQILRPSASSATITVSWLVNR